MISDYSIQLCSILSRKFIRFQVEIQSGILSLDARFRPDSIAKKYHPDVGGDTSDVDKFKEVVKAYETLSDINRRKIYDLSLTDSRFSEELFEAQGSANFVNKHTTEFYQNK